MDTVPQLVSWKDVDGTYLGTNRAFADFFGFADSEEVVSKGAGGVIRDREHVDAIEQFLLPEHAMDARAQRYRKGIAVDVLADRFRHAD